MPRKSGQNFDPIRSVNTVTTVPSTPPTQPQLTSTHASPNRASASPSISSLIDPPSHPTPLQYTQHTNIPQTVDITSSNASSPSVVQPTIAMAPIPVPFIRTPQEDSKMTSDNESTRANAQAVPEENNTITVKKAAPSTAASSSAPSPKSRQRQASPPMPQGNGLLSTALFGGPTSAPSNSINELRPPTVILHVPMKGECNKVVNFTKLAVEKYGAARLNPRLAANEERRRKIDAMSTALEKSSGAASHDEMSVDSDPESNVEMNGTEKAGSVSESGTLKRKRNRKEETYDTGDDFIDDSETAWEAQAAASKDGFFVYKGPLIPEGEKPAIERADGTVKRGRGRGRGGGPGSRGGRVASRGTGSGRGGGPGSRGGQTIRKPRVTKADKEKMENEKNQRESLMHIASKPVTSAVVGS